jgi:hypothetical protein
MADEIVLNSIEALVQRKEQVLNWNDTKIEPLFNDPLFNDVFGLVLLKERGGYRLNFKRLKNIPPGSSGYIQFNPSELKRIMERLNKRPNKQAVDKRGRDDGNVDDIPCEICKLTEADGDNDMPICSKCNKGYHLECIGMTKKDLPEDDWFCDKCAKADPIMQFVINKRVLEIENNLRTELAEGIRNVEQKYTSLSRELESFRIQGYNLLDTVVTGGSGSRKKAKRLAAVVPATAVTVVNGADDTSATSGACIMCAEKSKYVCLENLKSDMVNGRISTPSDPRRFKPGIAEKIQLHKKMLCKTHSQGKTCVIDKAHKLNYCIICRAVRSSKSEEGLCVRCADDCVNMKRGHAQTKNAFEKCMRVLHSCVAKVRNITFYHEMSVEDACTGAVDSVMEVLTTDNKKLVFVIEFQNTHRENPSMLTHKLLGVCAKLNPVRAFLMNVRISGERTHWKMQEKLDILRRWIIVLIYYYDKVPSRTYWEFFQGEDSPLEPNAEKSEFLSKPIVIECAPEGVISDWEFATDPYAGYIARRLRKSKDVVVVDEAEDVPDETEVQDDASMDDSDTSDALKKYAPWHHIIEKSQPVTDFLGGSFPKQWVGVYNVDQFNKLQHMQCKDTCEVCRKFLPAPVPTL